MSIGKTDNEAARGLKKMVTGKIILIQFLWAEELKKKK